MSDEQEQPSARAGSMQPSSNPPKVRRRNRIITSCLECRRRKLKCDRLHPCNHCAKASRDCVFLSPALDSVSKGKLNQFKESVENLEKSLEQQADGDDVLSWKVSSQNKAGSRSGRLLSEHLTAHDTIPEDEQYLEPTPMAVADVTYDDDGDDLLEDLGVSIGRLRITERIGGFVRPRFAEEIAESMRQEEMDKGTPVSDGFGNYEAMNSPPMSSDDTHSYLEPGPEYIAPGDSLLFPSASSEEQSLVTFLPSQDFADKLIGIYWNNVHLINRVVHRPSFERQYNQFWHDVAQGFEPAHPTQALIFGAMFSAAISLPTETTEAEFGCSREDMIRTFRAGCEYALSRSNLLRATKVPTIQAFVMYLIPACRRDVSRSHASLVSMAIRLAECAGLHRDGTTFGLGPVDIHVRRLIWYQLCFLDIRTVEAVGPRPSIRKEDFDTKLPLHVNDAEIDSFIPPKQDVARFTEMTAARIKFEAYEILRAIWVDRPLVEKGQMSLTSLLRKVEDFREYTLRKYMPLIDKSIPFHLYTAKLLQLLVHKMHVNVLQKYASSASQEMPERLLRVMWSSGIGTTEICLEMETLPILKPWAWYTGAYSQYHVALLLLFMVTRMPDYSEADRVWAGLDLVFEFPPNLTRAEKFKRACSITSHRLGELQKQRKRRGPTSVDQSMGNLSIIRATSISSASREKRESISSASHLHHSMPTPANSDSGYAPSVADLPTTDPWLNVQSSSSGNSGLSTSMAPLPQPQRMNLGQHAPPPQAFNNYATTQTLSQSSNPQGIGGIPAPQVGNQALAELDWDELNRLFPTDAPILNFDPQPGGQIKLDDDGFSAMTYFPNPRLRSKDYNSRHQSFGNIP